MRRWSNDRFLATPQGVLNESGTDRYSIAYFHSPNPASIIECLPTCVSADNIHRQGTSRRDLEAEVGAALFHRLAHGAELTEAGKAFLAGVQEMPSIAAKATMAARRAARGETGPLRVGFTASAAFNVVVPSAIRAFRAFRPAYTDIHLTLVEANTT